MTAALLPLPKWRAFDANGAPLAFGKVYTYEAGTLTPKDTYTDFDKNGTNTNPVELDAAGEADIWLDGNYKIKLTDENDVQQWVVDDVSSSGGGGSSGSNYVVTTGTANTYVATPNPALLAYDEGTQYYVKFNVTNTSASTINFSGLGAKNIILRDGSAMVAGDIVVDYIYTLIYDGTNFQIQGVMAFQSPSDVSITGGVIGGTLLNEKHGADVTAASTINLTNTTGNFVTITGNTTINTITLPDGYERLLRMTGTPTFTNSSTLVMQSGANFTAAAGDIVRVRGDAAGVVYAEIVQQGNEFVDFNGTYPAGDGSNITGLTGRYLGLTVITSSTTWNKPAGTNTIIVEIVGGGGEGGAASGTPGDGGTTSFGAYCSATGGGGNNGTPGSGSGGDINCDGSGAQLITGSSYAGAGGGSLLGGGGPASNPGGNYGGGGGGEDAGATGYPGGAGGGYSRKSIDVSAVSSVSVTIGAGGNGSTAGGNGSKGVCIIQKFS